NVVPEAYLPKPRPIIEVVSWAFVVVAVAVIVPLAIFTQQAVRDTSALQAQVNNAQLQVDIKQGTKAMLGKLQAELEEAKAAREILQQPLAGFEAQRAKVNGDLSKVTSLLPGTVDLKSISYGGSLKISGTAPDEATILSYVRALRDTDRFSQVMVSDMEEVEYNEWDFTVELK
ncbi:MAG TPA: hypothetical protein G4O12_05960, partial [Dehalococcoidia bacterium]|nr:hypothetical protein [Dehalococcoidia bacterium]